MLASSTLKNLNSGLYRLHIKGREPSFESLWIPHPRPVFALRPTALLGNWVGFRCDKRAFGRTALLTLLALLACGQRGDPRKLGVHLSMSHCQHPQTRTKFTKWS